MIARCEFLHYDLGVWSAEASELGLAPGVWPERIVALCDGVAVPGVRARIVQPEGGDVLYVDYAAVGRVLRVWND